MKAYIFPGQGAQFVGMGKDLYENPSVRNIFDDANKILGFNITDIMFGGTDEELKQTKVTQPAIFIHSVAIAKAVGWSTRAVRTRLGRLLERSPLAEIGSAPRDPRRRYVAIATRLAE